MSVSPAPMSADHPHQVPFEAPPVVVEPTPPVPAMGTSKVEMGDCKEEDVDSSNQEPHDFVRPEPSSVDGETSIIMGLCCCFAALIIGLCIWGIVASSDYDTNPAENWPMGSCSVKSVKDTVRACISCNTDTIW